MRTSTPLSIKLLQEKLEQVRGELLESVKNKSSQVKLTESMVLYFN